MPCADPKCLRMKHRLRMLFEACREKAGLTHDEAANLAFPNEHWPKEQMWHTDSSSTEAEKELVARLK